MVTSNIDLGQIIISACLVIIGFLLKRELSSISNKLERHEAEIKTLTSDMIQALTLIGTLTGRSPLSRTRRGDRHLNE